jgi:hypothetical protein
MIHTTEIPLLFESCANMANASSDNPIGVLWKFMYVAKIDDPAERLRIERQLAAHWYKVRHQWPFSFPEQFIPLDEYQNVRNH